jgi:Holliday junction DNA helicase RuvB
MRAARIFGIATNDDGAREIARRARGTPRIVNRLLRRVRDYAQVVGGGVITHEVAREALARLEVDELGLDENDRRLLRSIIELFRGGPVGLSTLAAALAEEIDAVEDVYEPFLLQLGFLQRTPRGRVATPRAYQHLGIPYREPGVGDAPGDQGRLW